MTEADKRHNPMDALEMAMPVATYSPFWTNYYEIDGDLNSGADDGHFHLNHHQHKHHSHEDRTTIGGNSVVGEGQQFGNVRSTSAPAIPATSAMVATTIKTAASYSSSTKGSWSSGSSTPSCLDAIAPSYMDATAINRVCANCQTNQTPFWRRAGDGQFYCNACGLYLRAHSKMRPIALQVTRQSKRIKCRVDSCSNCQAKDTPLWRRLSTGETVCNACGLYYKLHGSHRPVYGHKLTPSGKRPRVILPKYMSGEAWHQYLPPSPALPSSATHTPMPATGNDANTGGKDGHSQSTFHQFFREHPSRAEMMGGTNFDYIQLTSLSGLNGTYAPSTAGFYGNNSTFLPMFSNLPPLLPQPSTATAETRPRSRESGGVSLDDSMRWFTNTCLDGCGDNANGVGSG